MSEAPSDHDKGWEDIGSVPSTRWPHKVEKHLKEIAAKDARDLEAMIFRGYRDTMNKQ